MSQSKPHSTHAHASNREHQHEGDAFARALWTVIYKEEKFTAVEIAEVADCSDRHIYNVANGKSTLAHDKAAKVCRYIGKHGDMRPTYAFIPVGGRVTRPLLGDPDGDFTNDIMDIIRAATGIEDAAQNLNTPAVRRFCDQIRGELADIEAECAEVEGRR